MNAVQEQFAVHDRPAWRSRADFIVNVALSEQGRYEQIWCRQITDNSFEVCCIPFFLYDVALGDIIRTSQRGGHRYVVDRVERPSGRYVFRIHLDPSETRHGEAVEAWLHDKNALLEWSSASLVAVDARDPAHAREIADYLDSEERHGRLIYETGKTSPDR